MLQGFALGGEYGGAAIYVAEHARPHRRGWETGWIQVSAAFGLMGALLVVLITRMILGEEAFSAWGWRVPFLFSIVLLAISVWIRLQLEESPAFKKLKDEGKISKRAYHESFFEWRNLKVVILAFLAICMAQGVVWYTGFFYTQFYIERILKIDSKTVSVIMIAGVMLSAPLYVFFAWLSDKIGRKIVMLFGIVLMLGLYFPGFHYITQAGNPQLAQALERVPVTVIADPADCTFQLDLTGGARQFSTSCDIAKGSLTNAGVAYETQAGPQDRLPVSALATWKLKASAPGAKPTAKSAPRAPSSSHVCARYSTRRDTRRVRRARWRAGAGRNRACLQREDRRLLDDRALRCRRDRALWPQAAALVELFPTRIRYTALSVPYHIGVGWFGGLLPAVVFAINTATGSIYQGLWFPVIATAVSAVVMFFFLPETKDRDIHA
ncbi:MAG: MFS transporter [Caulobacteraceae bacterium]|nr:MFS transporter [Caulobacteraceae bacterium]